VKCEEGLIIRKPGNSQIIHSEGLWTGSSGSELYSGAGTMHVERRWHGTLYSYKRHFMLIYCTYNLT